MNERVYEYKILPLLKGKSAVVINDSYVSFFYNKGRQNIPLKSINTVVVEKDFKMIRFIFSIILLESQLVEMEQIMAQAQLFNSVVNLLLIAAFTVLLLTSFGTTLTINTTGGASYSIRVPRSEKSTMEQVRNDIETALSGGISQY
ncbi:MAG: hypothetical protein J6J58_05755 [Oscillospiraceae bacterium]|nr:hypothetical protein [Oscillospiraceae bacterium]MBQ5327440.1 hypothetical protein [Oscillospiraceae bacterium]